MCVREYVGTEDGEQGYLAQSEYAGRKEGASGEARLGLEKEQCEMRKRKKKLGRKSRLGCYMSDNTEYEAGIWQLFMVIAMAMANSSSNTCTQRNNKLNPHAPS
jgi:hypothetical protein